MRWDVRKDVFALWLKQMVTKIRSIVCQNTDLSLSLYLPLSMLSTFSVCLSVHIASAIYVWSSPTYFPSDSVQAHFESVLCDKYKSMGHTKRQNKKPSSSSSAPLSNHLFLPYHTCISQWSQFSVLHPLKSVSIHRTLRLGQLFNAIRTPWCLIVHFHVLAGIMTQKPPNVETMVDRFSKTNQKSKDNKALC